MKLSNHSAVAIRAAALVLLLGAALPLAAQTAIGGADTIPPTVPTGVVGTAVSATQIGLSWNPSTDNVGVTGYLVYDADTGSTIATTTTTSFTHSGLVPGTTHNYRVSAFDAVPNQSPWTDPPVSVTTPVPDSTAPSVPTGLTGKAVSRTRIRLSWTASTDNVGVTGYLVYDADTGSTIATTTTTSFTHSGLVPGTTHNYRVSAFDAVPNHSPWTDPPVSVKTLPLDTTAPSTPTEILASAVSSSQINLSWAASTDNVKVTRYIVRRDGVKIAAPVSTSYADTGLSAATTYSYTVAARDAAGNISPNSATASVTTGDTPPPPSNSAGLTWDSVTDPNLSGYRLYFGTAPGTYLQSVGQGTSVGNVTTYTMTGLASGSRYYFAVTAFDTLGIESDYSNEVFKDIP